MLWRLLVERDPRGRCWGSWGTSTNSSPPPLNLICGAFLEMFGTMAALASLPSTQFQQFHHLLSLTTCLVSPLLEMVWEGPPPFSQGKPHSCQKLIVSLSGKTEASVNDWNRKFRFQPDHPSVSPRVLSRASGGSAWLVSASWPSKPHRTSRKQWPLRTWPLWWSSRKEENSPHSDSEGIQRYHST